jgi:hypothetical protein
VTVMTGVVAQKSRVYFARHISFRMEALLNIVWFLIAAGSFIASIWVVPRDRRHLLPQLVTLLCVLILLFPTISITDDLQAETFVVEHSITKRTMSGAAYSSRIIPKFGVAIVPVAPLSAMLRCASLRNSEEMFESRLDSPAFRPTLGRAPPRLVA